MIDLIDPHVHCRDGNWAYKDTIAHVFELANAQGVKVIFDMPNNDPPIISEEGFIKRMKLVSSSQVKNYFLWLGLTADEKQLRGAVDDFLNHDNIIGFKLYAGKSVGDLAVIDQEEQIKIYSILTALEYTGVIAVHCEKERFLRPDLFNPRKAATHSLARPKEAEVASIQDQINFVKKTGFQGTLHIVHVSCPESVELVDSARKEIKITCGVTPHHILWNKDMMNGTEGLIHKTNPPLRDKEDVDGLREQLKTGKIDWIETDHAPHAIGEKLFPPYLSGFPSLYLYKDFVENFLPSIGLSGEEIRKLTHDNICQTFDLDV